MLTGWHFAPGRPRTPVDVRRPDEVVHSEGVTWFDLQDPTHDELQALGAALDLHPLALEDALEARQRPKVDLYDSHALIVVYSAEQAEVEMFVGKGWVLTVRHRGPDGELWPPHEATTRFAHLCEVERPSAGLLVYAILDEIVDRYFTVTDQLAEDVEALEDLVFSEAPGSSEHAVQQRILSLRRRHLSLRRAVAPMREVLATLARGEIPLIDQHAVPAFQDVVDHLLAVIEDLGVQRELIGNAVDAHLGVMANRTNKVMKKMTSWGAILFAASLVTGIYGMNFRHMPELHWTFGYPMALAVMVLLTVVLRRTFKRRDWL